MSTNHLSPEPPPGWIWRIATEQQLPRYHQQPRQVWPEGNHGREHLFEKLLTPSDVGKLNRLVIPKQHAERFFPLDTDFGEKGLLLSFEDESGRAWQFRYSYWTSSQSYVLTKGWSRFVKEKRLDAGDVVLFERRRGGGDRLCIGWRRRGEHAGAQHDGAPHTVNASTAQWNPVHHSAAAAPSPSGPLPNPAEAYSYRTVAAQPGLVHDAGKEAEGPVERAATSTPPGAGTSSRRLRLFGVNLDCGPEQDQPETNRPGSSHNSSSCMDYHGRANRFEFIRRGRFGSPQW